jgi:AcrR family transcriptional regulator
MSVNDAVDVSERTFFRYFANKEDLALSFVKDGCEALLAELAELAARPPAEEPLTALRNAFRESLRTLTSDDQPGDESAYLLVIKLIDTTPLLAAFDACADQVGPALSGHRNTR